MFSTGYHASQATLAPKGYLTGAEWNWEKVYKDYVEKIKSGSPWAHLVRGGFKEGFIKMSPYGAAVSAEAKAKADEAKAKLTAGTLVIFKGPLKDNAGKEIIAGGRRKDADRHLARADELPGRGRQGLAELSRLAMAEPVMAASASRCGCRRSPAECRWSATGSARARHRRSLDGSGRWPSVSLRLFGVFVALRGQKPARRVRRDVPRRVRHLVFVSEYACCGPRR